MLIPPPDPDIRCRLEWGRRGAAIAAERGDILVVVDVLSFSSAVAAGVEKGALIYPCAEGESAADRAREVAGQAAVHRRDVPARGRYSLSPLSFLTATAGESIVLSSPNGATCSRHAASAPVIICGSLLNRSAVAARLQALVGENNLAVTVVPCGERWENESEEGVLRFALEDYLGAGAIIAALGTTRTAEAELAAASFDAAADRIAGLIYECDSGRELRQKGFAGDVEFSAQVDLYASVPVLSGGAFSGVS